MALQGGGFQFSFEGRSIQVVSKSSPVGDELLDRRAGDTVEVEIRGQMKELEILSVE
jgi:transcription elongation GreA/GreB family factor